MSDAVKEFLDVLNDRLLKKPKPFDRQGVVKRVEGKTAFVRFNGSNIETPVQRTIDCKAGDTVQTRVAGKNAWLVGNLTAPPTDDRVAREAKAIARNVEKKSTEKFVTVDGLIDEQGKQIVYAIESANGKNTIYHSATPPTGSDFKEGDTWFDTDDDNKIYKWNGSAWSPVLLGDDALESLSANKITAGTIDASQITVSNLDAGNITSGTLDTARLNVTDLIQVGNLATEDDLAGTVKKNLVKNGYWDADFKNNINSWTKESSAVIDYDASTDLYTITCSSSYYGLTQTITVEANTDYVISASVGSNFHLGFGAPSYPKDSGTWSTASDGRKYKVVNSGSRTSMAVYAYAEADTCYINRIKVEKGSTYTGWYDDNTKDLSSKYLKFDTQNGLDIGYSGTNAKVNIDGTDVNIYDTSGDNVAKFGSSGRFGKSDDNHLNIVNDGFSFYSGDESSNTPFDMKFYWSGMRMGIYDGTYDSSTGRASDNYGALCVYSYGDYNGDKVVLVSGLNNGANEGEIDVTPKNVGLYLSNGTYDSGFVLQMDGNGRPILIFTPDSSTMPFQVNYKGEITAAHSGVTDITSQITNTGGKGTLVKAEAVTFGKVCHIRFEVSFSSVGTSSSNYNFFTGKLPSTYYPIHVATGAGYYGVKSVVVALASTGEITIRNTSNSTITVGSSGANLVIPCTYILA